MIRSTHGSAYFSGTAVWKSRVIRLSKGSIIPPPFGRLDHSAAVCDDRRDSVQHRFDDHAAGRSSQTDGTSSTLRLGVNRLRVRLPWDHCGVVGKLAKFPVVDSPAIMSGISGRRLWSSRKMVNSSSEPLRRAGLMAVKNLGLW